MSRRFATLDVFTADRLTGNPLAVVLDAEGLDTNDMQAIAGEFNLSETVFVFSPADLDSGPTFASSRQSVNCRLPDIRPSAPRFFLRFSIGQGSPAPSRSA